MPTLDQQAARHARETLSECPDDARGELRRLAEGLPAMVRRLGLGQTLAWHLGQQARHPQQPVGQAAGHLCARLAGWLVASGLYDFQEHTGPALLQAIQAGGLERYVQAQDAALIWSGWVKRFAQAAQATQAPPAQATQEAEQ